MLASNTLPFRAAALVPLRLLLVLPTAIPGVPPPHDAHVDAEQLLDARDCVAADPVREDLRHCERDGAPAVGPSALEDREHAVGRGALGGGAGGWAPGAHHWVLRRGCPAARNDRHSLPASSSSSSSSSAERPSLPPPTPQAAVRAAGAAGPAAPRRSRCCIGMDEAPCYCSRAPGLQSTKSSPPNNVGCPAAPCRGNTAVEGSAAGPGQRHIGGSLLHEGNLLLVEPPTVLLLVVRLLLLVHIVLLLLQVLLLLLLLLLLQV